MFLQGKECKDEDEDYVSHQLSAKILKQARIQQQELEEEYGETEAVKQVQNTIL